MAVSRSSVSSAARRGVGDRREGGHEQTLLHGLHGKVRSGNKTRLGGALALALIE